jgi:hypothetical protein
MLMQLLVTQFLRGDDLDRLESQNSRDYGSFPHGQPGGT